jgi:hypothetical protein
MRVKTQDEDPSLKLWDKGWGKLRPPHLNPLPPGERKERKKNLSHGGPGKKENGRRSRWGWKPWFDMPWHVATLKGAINAEGENDKRNKEKIKRWDPYAGKHRSGWRLKCRMRYLMASEYEASGWQR